MYLMVALRSESRLIISFSDPYEFSIFLVVATLQRSLVVTVADAVIIAAIHKR